jgi:guanylate kinase
VASAPTRSPLSSASLSSEADQPAPGPPRRAGGRAPAQSRKRLTVLAGPTAVGKGTVADDIRRHHPDVWISVSATTRPPRPGEVDGVHYRFVDEATFDQMVAAGDLLEWARVHERARYGTPRRPVEEALDQGRLALLEIDLQGARQVRRTMPDALFVFLAPPTWEELVRRLVGRATETDEERASRLATAQRELAAEAEFDATLVNAEIHATAEQLVGLMRASAQSAPVTAAPPQD